MAFGFVVIAKIVTAFSAFFSTPGKSDDDIADRLSSRYTVALLVVFAVGVVAVQSTGIPISCWTPPHFTGSHMKYAHSYCWVRNTYYFPLAENAEFGDRVDEKGDDVREYIIYYQWVPFILLGMAAGFTAPSVFWHGLNQKSGMDADSILQTAHSLLAADSEEKRIGLTKYVSSQIERFLQSRRSDETSFSLDIVSNPQQVFEPCCGTRVGSYLVVLFLISKILYIGNAIAQFFLLSHLLGFKFSTYGLAILYDKFSLSDTHWDGKDVVAFPRVTFCDFEIRRLGNLHSYTVQCALPMNMYSERIFIILWWWLLAIITISCCSFFCWLLRALTRSDRVAFIRNHLVRSQKIRRKIEKDELLAKEFVDEHLRQDGTFLVRLIAHNTSSGTASEIVSEIFDRWCPPPSTFPVIGETPEIGMENNN